MFSFEVWIIYHYVWVCVTFFSVCFTISPALKVIINAAYLTSLISVSWMNQLNKPNVASLYNHMCLTLEQPASKAQWPSRTLCSARSAILCLAVYSDFAWLRDATAMYFCMYAQNRRTLDWRLDDDKNWCDSAIVNFGALRCVVNQMIGNETV